MDGMAQDAQAWRAARDAEAEMELLLDDAELAEVGGPLLVEDAAAKPDYRESLVNVIRVVVLVLMIVGALFALADPAEFAKMVLDKFLAGP